MALPSSGTISLSQVNTELQLSSTATISMNDTNVRTLAGVSSGSISMTNLHGKSWWIYQSGTLINWSPITNREGFSPGPDARYTLPANIRPYRVVGTVVNAWCDWTADSYVYVQLSYDNQASWQTIYSRWVMFDITSGCQSSSANFDVTVSTAAIATHVRVYAPNRTNNITHNIRITEWYTR